MGVMFLSVLPAAYCSGMADHKAAWDVFIGTQSMMCCQLFQVTMFYLSQSCGE